ncbi:MAG TPA: hypothetical protein VJU58_13665, partial [Microbacterium sp.]|nr:hypothetical protein [Microbacterium sp.]
MKPIPAIVERDHDTVLATVRDRHSALRSAEAQISKTEKRLDDMRSAAELRRKELGKALTAAHELWPDAKAAQGGARGPGG